MTEPTIYFTAPDANEEPTLWRGTGTGPDDSAATAVATKHELDRLDLILWPTLVKALYALTAEETAALEAEIRERFAAGVDRPIVARYYRERTGSGIRQALAAVDRICADTEEMA